MNFATKDEFEALYGEGDDRVDAWLTSASGVIRRAIAGSSAAWASDPDAAGEAPEDVASLCLTVAFRGWNNPDGIESEQLGEHRVSYQRNGPKALELTATERRDLRKAAGLSSFQSVTQRTPFSPEPTPDSEALP